MNIPQNKQYILFGGNFVLANKMQWVADKTVEGLSTKQWFLLRTLQDMPKNPQPTITALAQEADTSRQNVAKMLEVLQRQGCVNLQASPSDHRSRNVEITAKGEGLLGEMAANAGVFFAELFAGIDASDCEIAARVTLQMIENLHRMQKALEDSERVY